MVRVECEAIQHQKDLFLSLNPKYAVLPDSLLLSERSSSHSMYVLLLM